MKKFFVLFLAILISYTVFASESLEMQRDKILEDLITDPASLTLLNQAKVVYSKLLILQSASSTQESVANAIIENSLSDFYNALKNPQIQTLPKNFDLVFNVLPIQNDYNALFTYISQGDYVNALRVFDTIKYLYKIPDLYKFLPSQNVVSLWNLFAQTINTDPRSFDVNAAKFVAAIATPYDIKNIYVKTYVWLSGLSVSQVQMGFNIVDFESQIASVSSVQMDPNLLQWKFTVSNYLALYSSINDAIREISSAKDLTPYVKNMIIFYRAIQDLPLQYRTPLDNLMSTYLDLVFQAISANPTLISSSISRDIKSLIANFPSDPNTSKLISISMLIPHNGASRQSNNQIWVFYAIVIAGAIVLLFTFPSVRVRIYNILGMHKYEIKIYMKALSRHPEDPSLHIKIASAYEKMGKYVEAQREYSLAMKLTNVNGGKK
ncbi:MAG: tetratricopeptide repeat protein [Athalassotoga sp.]